MLQIDPVHTHASDIDHHLPDHTCIRANFDWHYQPPSQNYQVLLQISNMSHSPSQLRQLSRDLAKLTIQTGFRAQQFTDRTIRKSKLC